MKAWAFIIDNSLLLVAGALSALVWANLDPASYDHFAHGPIHFLTNDVGMVFFFALATKQIIEARLPGARWPRRLAVLNCIGAGLSRARPTSRSRTFGLRPSGSRIANP